MASHEDTLAQLQLGDSKCGEIMGVIQNGIQMTAELLGILQNSLGSTSAYGEVGGYCEAVSSQLETAAQAVAQTSQTISGLMARFQGGGL